MFDKVKFFITGLLFEIFWEISNAVKIYNKDKIERKKLFKSRIWWIPIFLIFYYVFLSYSDFVLCQSVPIIEEHMLKFEDDENWEDWEERSMVHVAGSIIFFSGYLFLTLIFVSFLRNTIEAKYAIFNGLFYSTHVTYNLYWHIIYIYSAFNLYVAPILYWFIFWAGLFLQWAVDLEEDIDFKEELEDDSIRKKGVQPDQRLLPLHLSPMEFILALGTTAEPIETPAQTLNRYNLYKQRLKNGYGGEFDYQKPPTEERISYRRMFTNYTEFLYAIRRFFTHIISVFYKIFLYLEFFLKVIYLYFFLWKGGFLKRPKAVGHYEHYNPFFNLNYLTNFYDRTFAPIVLKDLPDAIKDWNLEMKNERIFLPYITDVNVREARSKQLDIDEIDFAKELIILQAEIDKIMADTKAFDRIFWSTFSKKIAASNELSTYKAKKFAQLLFIKKL